jgi:hypothetical protein
VHTFWVEPLTYAMVEVRVDGEAATVELDAGGNVGLAAVVRGRVVEDDEGAAGFAADGLVAAVLTEIDGAGGDFPPPPHAETTRTETSTAPTAIRRVAPVKVLPTGTDGP